MEGVLLSDNRNPILRVDGGGEWRLDLSQSVRHLLGKRVRVVGVRSEFDMIDVVNIDPL